MADHRAPVPEAASVHPKGAKSSSGAHARPSRAKVDTPRVPQSQCGGLEGGAAAAMTAGAMGFFPTCYPSPTGNGDDEE
jgi:hypothetical protein